MILHLSFMDYISPDCVIVCRFHERYGGCIISGLLTRILPVAFYGQSTHLPKQIGYEQCS